MEKKIKITRNIIILSLTIIIGLITYLIIYNSNKTKIIKNNLKKNNYSEVSNNIFSKTIDKNNTNINYTYNFNMKKFTKYIKKNNDNNRQEINITLNNNETQIDYLYQNTSGCKIVQKATYEKNNYKCDIVTKKGNCTSKCDIILKEAKNFNKEAKKIIK
ncbi:MAG: hypothetical protein IKE90_02160 [Bacilli bacterium]|nr:hypothetical protein [Bacilli bacterium]